MLLLGFSPLSLSRSVDELSTIIAPSFRSYLKWFASNSFGTHNSLEQTQRDKLRERMRASGWSSIHKHKILWPYTQILSIHVPLSPTGILWNEWTGLLIKPCNLSCNRQTDPTNGNDDTGNMLTSPHVHVVGDLIIIKTWLWRKNISVGKNIERRIRTSLLIFRAINFPVNNSRPIILSALLNFNWHRHVPHSRFQPVLLIYTDNQ